MANKRKINLKLVLGFYAIILIILVSTVSYGFLSTTVISEKKSNVVAGVFNVDYQDEEYIQLLETYPISDEAASKLPAYNFTITNTGNVDAKYSIRLEEDESIDSKSLLTYNQIKYSIKEGEGTWSQPALLSTLGNGLYLVKNRTLDAQKVNSSINYSLKIWVDYNVGNEGQNKIFKGKVVVESVQNTENVEIENNNIKPIIILNDPTSEQIEQNANYEDPGIKSVTDDRDILNVEDVELKYEFYDGNTTEKVDKIDTTKIGVYYITYSIKDTDGNEGIAVRTVNVYRKDTTPPTIKLNGEEKIYVSTGKPWVDPGATAYDEEEGDISDRILVIGKVNYKKPNTYIIKYHVQDKEGNIASVARTVIVKDDKTVIISLVKSDGVASIEKEELTCDIIGEQTECQVVLPTITPKPGYDTGFWAKNKEDNTGLKQGDTITVTDDETYYAKALDTTKPVCKFVSATPNIVKIDESIDLVFECTDTSGSVSSTLSESDITVKLGTTDESPDVKKLAEEDIDNGKRYTLSLKDFKNYGEISLKIASNKIKDISGNGNDEVTFQTEANVRERVYVTYEKSSGVDSITKESDYCDKEVGVSTCQVTLPGITSKAGYNTGFWTTSASSLSGTDSNVEVSVSANTTYWAKALDTTVPICKVTDESDVITVEGNHQLTIECSDTSNTLTSNMSKSYIEVYQGSYKDNPTITVTPENESGGVEGTLKWTVNISDFQITSGGNVSITILDGAVKDESDNTNVRNNYPTQLKVRQRARIFFSISKGVSEIGNPYLYCDVPDGSENCTIYLPTITSKPGYDTGFWGETTNATSGFNQNAQVNISNDNYLYAIALDTTAPVCQLYSVSPTGTVLASNSVDFVIDCTDTTGTLGSTPFSTSNITVNVGGMKDSNLTKNVSSSNITDGKRFDVSLSNFSTGGSLSVTFESGLVYDESGNTNSPISVSPSITIDYTVYAYFFIGTGVNYIDNQSYSITRSCQIIGSAGSCAVTFPTIQVASGYSNGYWVTSTAATSGGYSPGTNYISYSSNFYAMGTRSITLTIIPSTGASTINGSSNTYYGYCTQYGNNNCGVYLPSGTAVSGYDGISYSASDLPSYSKYNQYSYYYISANTTIYAYGSQVIKASFSTTKGTGVSSLGSTTSQSCTRYGNGSCSVTFPSITVTSTYEKGYWSTSSSGATDGLTAGASHSISESATYYSYGTILLTATFNKHTGMATMNNSSTTTTQNKTCRMFGSTACKVTTPAATADTGYTNVYWATSKTGGSRYTPGNDVSITANKTYYGIGSKTITITFKRYNTASGVEYITDTSGTTSTSKSCTKYGDGTCSVTNIPTIHVATGYTEGFWYTTTTASADGKAPGSSLTGLTESDIYYAIAKGDLILTVKRTTGCAKVNGVTTTTQTFSCTRYGSKSCSITLPTLTATSGYTRVFFAETSTGASVATSGSKYTMTADKTLYARGTKKRWFYNK